MVTPELELLLVGIPGDSCLNLTAYLQAVPGLCCTCVPSPQEALQPHTSGRPRLIILGASFCASPPDPDCITLVSAAPVILYTPDEPGPHLADFIRAGALEIWRDSQLQLSDVTRALRYAAHFAPLDFGEAALRAARAEASLKKLQARFSSIQSIAKLGYMEYQADTDNLIWSEGVYRILGLEPSFEPTLDTFLGAIHPDDRFRYSLARAELLQHRVPLDQDIRILRPDGSTRWGHVVATAVHDENGKLLRFEATLLDVTDVQELEDNLERFFALTDDMICIASFDGYFLEINAAAERILGYPRSYLTSHPFLHFVHPDDVASTAEETQRILEHNPTTHFENRYRCADGSYKWIRWTSTRDDAHQRIYAIASDITDSKEAQLEVLQSRAALQQAHDQLELRINERTAELQQANRSLHEQMLERQMAMGALQEIVGQLEVAKNDAERANAAKSEFLSRMSHELRTPMNSIMGFAQILEMAALGERQQQRVSHIIKAGQHLLQLINEVLDFSRVESGRLRLVPESVSVDSAILNAADIVRPLVEKNNLSLRLPDLTGGANSVLADSQRLAQVLLNLLSNAIKYNRPHGSITVRSEVLDFTRLRVTVSDTGRGIPEEQLKRLFVPFERLNPEDPDVEGTGLGLALSKNLVEAMGGTMGVRSVLGEGSEFWFELPLSPEVPCTSPGNSSISKPGLRRARATILYIEDSLSNYQVLEDLFQDEKDIFLMGAIQGRMGLELARQHLPSLILLDLHLPDIPGEEVLRRLREDPTTAAIPVVILSADASPSQIKKLQEAGAQDYITKPLDMKRLMRAVSDLIS